ncbi:hypothetical protein GF325_14520 [Candidatus Bathyarchaeota archaeon]|nr:hypothetical protein [Candidatus Bathyarchaeota archaeon]
MPHDEHTRSKTEDEVTTGNIEDSDTVEGHGKGLKARWKAMKHRVEARRAERLSRRMKKFRNKLDFSGYGDNERYKSVAFNHWEDIGFQRPLGDFLYGYMITIFTTILGLVMVSFIYQFLWPYPEIQGYNGIAGGVFAIVYQLFDVGTAFGIVRFIAEYRVKEPKRMIEYAQFYIWYQMFTGIIQVLILSVIILNAFRFGQFAYLTWVFLIILQKQWPGMLGTFKAILEGLQLYNKTQILSLISGEVFQNLTNIIFIIIGRFIGSQNPAIGELMGMVLGAAIGSYIDDFFAMWLAAYYFNKALKPFGVTARECFRVGFRKDIAKECLWFGLQVSIVPLINTATGTWMLLMYVDAMPQYATFVTLKGLAAGISGVVNVGSFKLTASLAESYMNDKEELARFYLLSTFKWNGFLMCFLTFTLLGVLPMLITEVTRLPGLENYVLAAPFLIPTLIHQFFRPWIDMPNSVLIATRHIGFYTFVRLLEEGMQVFFIWLFLYGLKLNVVFGFNGIVFILSFEHFFPRFIKMIMCWVYTQKRIFKLKLNFMQTFVIPIVSSIPTLLFGNLYYLFAFKPIENFFVPILGEYALLVPAAIYVVIGILIVPLCIFLPLTGFLGGWDDFGLLTFRKAVDLSGPSRLISMPLYKAVLFGARRSPLHNRWKMDWSQAAKEIQELMEMKEEQKEVKYEKPISSTAPWIKRVFGRDDGGDSDGEKGDK